MTSQDENAIISTMVVTAHFSKMAANFDMKMLDCVTIEKTVKGQSASTGIEIKKRIRKM